MVTTLAGLAGRAGSADGSGSAARFNQPSGVATDSAGNVYVADFFNHTMRKITPDGVVTTLAGLAGSAGNEDGTGSAARLNLPQGIAADSAGNIYAAENHAIVRGSLALPESASIDVATGPVGAVRQLQSSAQDAALATNWSWTRILGPPFSSAILSSTTRANPTFTPDVRGFYRFRLTATDGERTSITVV